jgi:hypothetical protein
MDDLYSFGLENDLRTVCKKNSTTMKIEGESAEQSLQPDSPFVIIFAA